MVNFLLWYGLAALTHLFMQINFSHREYLNQYIKKYKMIYPTVAIVTPSYNEPTEDMIRCIESCLNQKYPSPIKVIVIDDGSKDKTAINKLKKLTNNNLVIIEHKKNLGKRHAHKTAFDLIDKEVDIIVTIDSDTILQEDTILNLVQQFRDEKIGAITGNVRGKRENFLSKLIDMRYWTAFNQERCAQSLFGTVLCCCGVLAAYRSNLIRKVKNAYVSQTFLGSKCTFGDDRHLTNLVLNEGYKVKYEIRSKAITSVPLTFKKWLKQQVRWNRSFYRELLWSIKMVAKDPKKLSPYIIYDLTMQTILPFFLIIALILMIFRTVNGGIIFLFGYLAVLVGVSWIRGIYAIFRTKEYKFLMFPLYAFLHVFLLIPVRFYAIATLKKTTWGTR